MAENNTLFSDFLTKGQFCDAVPGGPISTRTADRWHTLRTGPPRIKVGRTILYRKQDVEAWLTSRVEARPA